MTKISIVLAAQKQAIGCRLQQIASPIDKKKGKFQCHRLLINTSEINRPHRSVFDQNDGILCHSD